MKRDSTIPCAPKPLSGPSRFLSILAALAALIAVSPKAVTDPVPSPLQTSLKMSPPKVLALGATILDAESGEVLWSRNGEFPRYPASTTKIMTALLLLERCKPDDIITAPADIEQVRESSMHLRPGEKVSARDMLYALMLRSANDGCVAVADHISGSVPAFAALMNQRAKELGCQHTHFHNPNGLNDSEHTVSPHDLALIAQAAMQHPEFRAVVRIRRHKISRSINQKDLWMVSKNKYLSYDKTADGIKTGWTIPAGHCYVGSATRHGVRIITAILKSPNWAADNAEMLDWAFSHFKKDDLKPEGETFRLSVPRANDGAGTVVATGPSYFLIPKQLDAPRPSLTFTPDAAHRDPSHPNSLAGHYSKGDEVGEMTVDCGTFSCTRPAVAADDYPANAGKVAGAVPMKFSTFLIGGVLIGSGYALKNKTRRRFYASSKF